MFEHTLRWHANVRSNFEALRSFIIAEAPQTAVFPGAAQYLNTSRLAEQKSCGTCISCAFAK